MDREIYDLLCQCAENADSVAWNQFRMRNRKRPMDLAGAALSEKSFSQFNFKGVDFSGADLSQTTFIKCAMDKCRFEDIKAFGICFEQSSLVSSNFAGVSFAMAAFIDTDLRYADFTTARIHQSRLLRCKSTHAIFTDTSFNTANLSFSDFSHANLSGTEILNTELNSSSFTACMVSGDTIIWDCYYDKSTDFTGVGLAACRIEPSLLSSFQCNIRRIWWTNWYAEKRAESPNSTSGIAPLHRFLNASARFGKFLLNSIVKLFWWITDYGSSTIRLLLVFCAITSVFALLYLTFPALTNDSVLREHPFSLLTVSRSVYFAVIIMTGLGFGDIAAAPNSTVGHMIMMLQSLIGYIILGAFLVRIGILFQGEFPVSQTRSRPPDDRRL